MIKTYQDLLKVSSNDIDRMNFVYESINEHKSSKLYKIAVIAYEYFAHRNVTIKEFKKMLYTVTGKAIEDIWSSNAKMACRHFYRFLTQENQFLLGNGVQWQKSDTSEKLGTPKKPFDNQLQEAGINALIGAESFGFYNLDHIDVFKITEYAPLYDELDGSMKSGIRFWQIANNKPLRATLYEMDGYTDYAWVTSDKVVMPDDWIKVADGKYKREKKKYILNKEVTEADGEEIVNGENYKSFPIVPFWGNKEHQSEIVGLREQIDRYDLLKSQAANNEDEAGLIIWTLRNANGMSDVDLAKFMEKIKTLHAVTVEDDVEVDSHPIDRPYAGREALLDRIDKDLYRDAMALDVERIADGATTATQIKAAYEPLNSKCDMYEYCVLDFIQGILQIAGVEDEPTFTRSMIVNQTEMIQTLSQAAAYLPEDYVVDKMLNYLGDGDKAEEVISQIHADNLPSIDDE